MKSNMFDALSGSSYVRTRPYMGTESTFDEPYNDNDFRQVKKYNKIAKKLSLFDQETKRKLSALFDLSYRYPMILTASFDSTAKRRTGLALFQVRDIKDLIELCSSKQKVKELSNKLDIEYINIENRWKDLK